MTAPLVSCIVPSYNAAAHIEGAIENILAQTHRPLEVVVADDGSQDETVALASAYGDPVRVVVQPTAGPAATRNVGLRAARGQFLAFLDPDDRWAPEKTAIQLARFRDRPELDCSVTHVQMVWAPGHEEEARGYRDHPRMRPIPGYATTTLLARASAFERVGDLDQELWFADAVDWFVRAREAGLVIELLPGVLVDHHLHAGNLTRRGREASAGEFIRLVKGTLDRRRARESA